MPAGSEPAPGSEMPIADPLPLVDRLHQHAQVRAVRRQGVGRHAAADLLLDADHGAHRQVRAADVLRRVQAEQAEFVGDFVQAGVLDLADAQALALGLARQHRRLQRHQLVADEVGHQVLEHPVLFGDLEIHQALPSRSLPRSCKSDHNDRKRRGEYDKWRRRGNWRKSPPGRSAASGCST
jgi:hypothetical protein